jgi:hypothetical protein
MDLGRIIARMRIDPKDHAIHVEGLRGDKGRCGQAKTNKKKDTDAEIRFKNLFYTVTWRTSMSNFSNH